MKKVSIIIVLAVFLVFDPAAATPASALTLPDTITVITKVINDNGGTATLFDFPLFLNGNYVASGQSLSFAPGVYTVTQTSRLPGYTTAFTGDCDANGRIIHGDVNNICTVVNNDVGALPVASGPPLIDLAIGPSPLALPKGPGPVTYTYTLNNVGTVPVTSIAVVGDTCSPITLVSGDINTDSNLDVNETWDYRCTTTLSATHTNTATASGFANGLSTTDTASAKVVVDLPGLPNTGSVPPFLNHATKIPTPKEPPTREPVPQLPSTGFAQSISWNIVIPVAILMLLVLTLFVVRRKRTI